MEVIAFTIVAVLLYLFSDWVLNRLELSLGRRLKNRSLIFFAILAPLAIGSFWAIQALIN